MRVSSYTYQQDTDCTSRSLATLLVAWVGAAMVASVLLRWKYMWLALGVLTLLFLIACGYAACNARRAHQRIVNRSNRPSDRNRQSDEQVQTVSRVVDRNYVIEPPSYQTFLITDLPPAYSAVIRSQPATSLPNYHLSTVDEHAIGPRLSNPPPYSVAIESDVTSPQNGQPANRTLEPHLHNFQDINQLGNDPWPLEAGHHIVRTQSFSEIPQVNEDKEPKERRRSKSTGTGYLSNLINYTFSRGERRANEDQTDHPTPQINEQRLPTS